MVTYFSKLPTTGGHFVMWFVCSRNFLTPQSKSGYGKLQAEIHHYLATLQTKTLPSVLTVTWNLELSNRGRLTNSDMTPGAAAFRLKSHMRFSMQLFEVHACIEKNQYEVLPKFSNHQNPIPNEINAQCIVQLIHTST